MKMRWLMYAVLLFSTTYASESQNVSITEEELERMYHEAIAEVLEQQADTPYKSRTPPYFKMPDDFMRSFVPGTGVGNREELVIDGMFPLPVFEDIAFSRLLLKHFNNTDYIAGISPSYVVLMKLRKSVNNYLVLSNDDIVLTAAEIGVIKDVVLFTRLAENTEVFSIAVATETPKASVVYIYEVHGDYGMMVSMIDLNIDPSISSIAVKKISYVQSSYGGSLVVLTNREAEKRLSYSQRGHSKLNHFIEVNYPSAIDLVTFSVHGHGYIAVANNRLCEIYKLDEFVKSDILFDKLGPFSAVLDLEYFRLGFHHFLAVADFENIHLYTWKKGEFALEQTIPVRNLAQVFAASVETCRDEVMLLAITWNGDISLYVFSGQNEKFTKVEIAVPDGYTVLPGSLVSFTSQHNVVILFENFHYKLDAFVIKTSLTSLRDPLLVQGDEVSRTMKSIQETIDNQKKEMNHIKRLLENAVRNTGTQNITSVQYFGNLFAMNGTKVESVNRILVKWEDSMLTLEEYRQGTDDLERTIESLERVVAEIESKITDVVRLDKDIVITGPKIFTGEVSADDLITTSLNLQNVAGIDLPQLQKDIYRLDNPEIIDGTLTFTEPLNVTGNFEVDTTINGIDIGEEVMTTDTYQVSNAQMIFTKPLHIRGDLNVSGKVNGIDISEEVVLLDGIQYITAPKNFRNGIKVVDLETKFLDGIDVDELYNKAFTISGNQALTRDSSFASITTNDIILNGKLNGYDIKEIVGSIVRTDQPSNITALKNFLNDVKMEELVVHGTVNGLKIPDDLVLTDRSQPITGSKEFLGEVTASEVIVNGLVDGLKLPGDIITLSENEEISSTLYFADGIVAEKDIVVEGHVDGVDISEIAKQAMKLNESNAFKHALFLGPVTITGNLNVRGKINNIDLNKLIGDIVYRDEKNIQINVKKTFKKVFADEVRLDQSINGFNINVDFMKVTGNQNISGTKVFKNTVFNAVHIDDGMIDGVNILDLYQKRITIEIENEEPFDREIEFVDSVTVKDLVIEGTVNGLRIPEDVVLRNSNQSISNKHFANWVTVDNLIVDGDINVDNFDGINLTEFYNNRITISGHQNISGDIWLGNVTATKVSIAGLVNGIDIKDFASNVMSKSKPLQTVTAAKEFSGNVMVYGDIETSEGVNGLNLTEINKNAFKLSGDNVVTAPLEFEDNVTVVDLIVEDINGVSITRLNEDSLKKTGDIQYVKGDVFFEAGFDVVGDIVATKVNGLFLPEDVLLKTIPQTIKGQFTFKSMAVNGDMTVNGLINGMDLSEIIPKLEMIDEVETVIESNVTFAGFVHVQENIDVSGRINDVDLKKLFENSLRKKGDQPVYGHKIFRGNVEITGDIDVGYVNGVNWKEFLDDIVWINKSQVVHSSKVFKGDVSVQNMLVLGPVTVHTINGKDLDRFITDAVFIDEPANITGPIIFKNPVEIQGDLNADLINGLNLKTDVITITCSEEGPQLITGLKTFENVKVFGDIVADSVNSHNLQELYENTLLTVGNQTVTGRKIIHGDVVFKKDVYPDTVNGIILNRDLVTIDTDQDLEGPLVFQGDVNVRQDMVIEGLLNGVDLYNLSRDIVNVKEDQIIEGAYTLDKAVVLSNVEVEGLVNDIDLAVFDRNVSKFLQETEESIAVMEKHTDDQCQIAKYLQESLKDSYLDLDGFVLHQDFEFPASFVQVDFDSITLVSVDDTAKSTTAVKNIWDKTAKKFSSLNFMPSLVAKSLSYRIGNLDLIIDIGIKSKDSSVRAIASGNQIELQKDFVDASVMVTEKVAIIAIVLPNKGTCDVYLLKDHPQVVYSYDLDSSLHISKDATSVELFELSGRLCLAVSSSHSPFVSGYSQIFTKKDNSWELMQRVPTSGSFVKHFEYQNYHYLAFANSAPIYETKEPKSIQIYRNSGVYESMFLLFQKVLFDDARGMELFNFGDLMQLHMVTWNETRIAVFALEGESGMRERFTIYGKCVKDVKPLSLDNELYLIVGQQDLAAETVTSVLYKGITKGAKYEPYSLKYC